MKGEGNSVNYKYRMHDPRIGRFFAVDPLADKYPHNGPYNFSENRVLDGIELEGLEFLNKDEALLYLHRGQLFLRIETNQDVKHELSKVRRYAKYPKEAYTGEVPAGGRVTEIKPLKPIGPDGRSESGRSGAQNGLGGKMTKQSGYTQPDKRYAVSNPSSVRNLGKAGLVINAVIIGYEAYRGYASLIKYTELNRQKNEVYDKTLEALNYGISEGLVPEKFNNEGSLDQLFNVIMYGGEDSTPSEIKTLGLKIFNTFEEQNYGKLIKVGRDYDAIENGDFHVEKSDALKVEPTTIKQ